MLQLVRLLVVVGLFGTFTGFALLGSSSQLVSTPIPECGSLPALRIVDLTNHNAGLLFCGANLPNAALVYDARGKWWLIADSQVEPNSVSLAGLEYGAYGAQIYALLPSPCSLNFKLSPRSVPKQLLVSSSPIVVETPKGTKLSNYLLGGTRPACHNLQVRNGARGRSVPTPKAASIC